MGMALDEAREQGAAGELDGSCLDGVNRAGRTRFDDAAFSDKDGPAFVHRFAVEHPCRLEKNRGISFCAIRIQLEASAKKEGKERAQGEGHVATIPLPSFPPPSANLRHNRLVDLKAQIDELATLMTEFGLNEAELKGEGWRVALRKGAPRPANSHSHLHESSFEEPNSLPEPLVAAAQPEEAPKGTPVNSPMTGIYYTSSSPAAPQFVKVGDVVEAGQVVGLIEAMKVFNEIVAPLAGTVTDIAAENGQLVQPGEPLLYIA